MMAESCEPHRWEGDVAWLGTPAAALRPGEESEFYDPVRPSQEGNYDLGQVGWRLVVVSA